MEAFLPGQNESWASVRFSLTTFSHREQQKVLSDLFRFLGATAPAA
jgi:hypothetical protein